jgi:hypothetical protein
MPTTRGTRKSTPATLCDVGLAELQGSTASKAGANWQDTLLRLLHCHGTDLPIGRHAPEYLLNPILK